MTTNEMLVRALVIFAEHGVEPDMQELLVYGNETRGIRPGALPRVLAAITAPEAKSEVAVMALEWSTAWGPDADGDVCFSAGTPFGSFNVERLHGSWRWRYCFDEYYDEESFECEDEADGKQKAQEHWNGRLAPFIRSALVNPEGGV